jgi:hypothetical protein
MRLAAHQTAAQRETEPGARQRAERMGKEIGRFGGPPDKGLDQFDQAAVGDREDKDGRKTLRAQHSLSPATSNIACSMSRSA